MSSSDPLGEVTLVMTEPEPVYSYVPGQGWVIVTHPFAYTKTADGVPVRITLRKPNPGEYCDSASKELSLEQWVGVVTTIKLQTYERTRYGHPELDSVDYPELYWMTLERVD